MTKTALFLSAALVPGFAIAAVQTGDRLGSSADDIIANLEADGYIVTETETENGRFEAEAMLDGVLYEIEVDLGNGEVIEVELDDDEDPFDHDEEDEDEEEDDDEDEDEDDDDDGDDD